MRQMQAASHASMMDDEVRDNLIGEQQNMIVTSPCDMAAGRATEAAEGAGPAAHRRQGAVGGAPLGGPAAGGWIQ